MNILVAADSVLLGAGLARLLHDAGMTVVAEAADADDVVRKARAYRPDVAVLALERLPSREELPGVAVLVLGHRVDEATATALLEPGSVGVGYLLEERVPDVERFLAAVREVASGGTVLDPAVVGEVLGRRARRDPFSPREREVLELMAQGRSNRAIAKRAYLSERAVERHVTTIFHKLALPSQGTHRRVLAVLAHLRASTAAYP